MTEAGQQGAGESVAILLSTYNGARFLLEQLHSLLAQTHRDWVLYWRDDGSSDGTQEVVGRFLANLSPERRCTLPQDGRLGSAESFLQLLRVASDAGHAAFAFADQDDIWLPEKLARGFGALGGVPEELPALYCARQVLVDEQLHPLGMSPPVRRAPGFPGALTQNVATGCTMMLNRPAAALISRSQPPALAMHDWWSYLLVAASGGRVLVDDMPVVLYRQHADNVVGAPPNRLCRGTAALRRGPGAFMRIFRQHLAALAEQPDLPTAAAAQQVAALERALRGGRLQRLPTLRMPGLVRQTRAETALFRLWFLLG